MFKLGFVIILGLIFHINSYGQVAVSGAQSGVVVGTGSVGGVVLISGGARLVLNGNKVYDQLGNVKDVVVGSGQLSSKNIDALNFVKSIKSESYINLIYNPDLGNYVQITADKNILPFVNVVVNSDGVLQAKIQPGGYIFKNRIKIRFGGSIEKFSLSGGDVLEVEGKIINNLTINQSGSSVFVMRSSKAETIRITSSGSSSSIILTDEPINLNIKISGGSNILVSNAGNIFGSISGGASLVVGENNGTSKVSVTGGGRFLGGFN